MNALVDAWKRTDTRIGKEPYLFCKDSEASLEKNSRVCVYRSFGEYVRSDNFADPNDPDFHIGLLPQPYFGNLKSASIFILMLNPGLSPGDYFAEQHYPSFRKALIRSLRQENEKDEYPFIFLNPSFAWHPGFSYYHKRFAELARLIEKRERSYSKALSVLAKNVACLQLMPYHSRQFGSPQLLEELKSTRAMLDFVHGDLKDRAIKGKVTVIVARGNKRWRFGQSKHKNVVVYKPSEARAAWITPTAKKRIVERLDLKGD